MRDIPELVEGYRSFRINHYDRQVQTYRVLAERGQTPRTMVIACSDSRVDPATIFSAGPGQLFVVRNVANLVPPFEPFGDYHGTSAAIEFAVANLGVATILVMGHGRCGGIAASLAELYDPPQPGSFIAKWLALTKPARGEALRATPGAPSDERQRVLEHASIRHSIDNLLTFPFVRERVERGSLRLRGAYFDIFSGDLLSLEPSSGAFERVI
jgi:carbonic anhydrase